MEGVQAGRAQSRHVVEEQPAADQQPGLVAGFADPRGFRAEHGEAVGDAVRGSGGQIGVEAGQPGELQTQRVPVGGPVEGAVEGPLAAVEHVHQGVHGVQVGPAPGVEKPEHELLGALGPQPLRRLAQRVQLLRVPDAEPVGQPQHHAQRDVHGGPDRAERGPARRQPVRRHVGDQFKAVRPAVLGRYGIVCAERDHLEDWSRHMRMVPHPSLPRERRPQPSSDPPRTIPPPRSMPPT